MKLVALRITLLATATLAASGCVYKMAIQQGNYLVAESVSQLKEGMTRSQVRFLLGTPMVPVAFDDSRWDYYYFFSSRHIDQPLKRRLTVYFADDKVQRFENIGVPTQTDLEQLERDLKRAIAENKKNQRKPGFFKRLFGRDAPAEPTKTEPSSSSESEAERPPDPVPDAAPPPLPAGTPSGPT
jgi:outer membrane protein assembly factor BamE